MRSGQPRVSLSTFSCWRMQANRTPFRKTRRPDVDRDLLLALRDALTLAIETSEENVLDRLRDERGELVVS